ncbi:hypothetical protein LSTR_LSTR012007 [Laodelphax striatellus]|uniref:Uncharacterized protein n=1 Tax=Laodelphax striatellus TaxID=195883 RepID=A0A482WH50_LAOST|nr:hypothetical protein LSTR_LSTR012007 [Laodelphax striatellus]
MTTVQSVFIDIAPEDQPLTNSLICPVFSLWLLFQSLEPRCLMRYHVTTNVVQIARQGDQVRAVFQGRRSSETAAGALFAL